MYVNSDGNDFTFDLFFTTLADISRLEINSIDTIVFFPQGNVEIILILVREQIIALLHVL